MLNASGNNGLKSTTQRRVNMLGMQYNLDISLPMMVVYSVSVMYKWYKGIVKGKGRTKYPAKRTSHILFFVGGGVNIYTIYICDAHIIIFYKSVSAALLLCATLCHPLTISFLLFRCVATKEEEGRKCSFLLLV